jgi:hypothetical protein
VPIVPPHEPKDTRAGGSLERVKDVEHLVDGGDGRSGRREWGVR